jgi:hypothetical protein
MHSEINDQSKKIWNPKHLSQVEETYWAHLKFGIWAGIVLMWLGIVSVIHALFPFLFSRYPDAVYKYFINASQKRISRVNTVLKNKNLE